MPQELVTQQLASPKLRPGRTSAIGALVRELPTPVVGDVCGIRASAAARWATEFGIDRASYPHHRETGHI